MITVLKRILLIGFAQLLLFEVIAQVSIHWRESTSELCEIALIVATFIGLIWAVFPAFSKLHMLIARVACRSLLIVMSFVTMYAIDYFHYWHLRPNLGLYRESDWVAEHPEFQRQMQERISNNMWRSPNNTIEETSR